MPDGFDMSRREFMLVGATSALSLSGQAKAQVAGGNSPDGYEFQGVADLMGPEHARPPAGSEFFDNKIYFWYRYEASDTGNRYFISQDDDEWTDLTVIPTNQLDEVETQSAVSFFNHTFARPEAPDSKNWDFTDGDVTKFGSEVELASTAVLETKQRGNYPPGSEATAGVALRITGTPTAGEGMGGYFTANNGLLVGEDATDSFVAIRKGGTEKRVYRPDWNGHVPDDRVWQNNRPVITRFPHLFYGGGDLAVNALLHDSNGSELRTLHTFTPDSVDDTFSSDGPPIDQPNLPARFESNSLSGRSVRANACHYQFSLTESENRVNGEHFGSTTVGTSGWTELLTWQKRTGWEMVNVRPLKITVAASSNPVRLELQLGPSTSTVTTSLPENTSSSETAVEIIDGTISPDGERRWVGYSAAGQGSSSDSTTADDLTFNLPTDQPVALFAQSAGSGDADVGGAVAWKEFF